MKKITIKPLLTLLLMQYSVRILSQSTTTCQNMIWVNDFVKAQINNRWMFYFDGSFRTIIWLNSFYQLKLNPGITRNLNTDKLSVTAGFCYMGTIKTNYIRPEYRPWEQIQQTKRINKYVSMSNRIRIEQRFSQKEMNNSLINNYSYNNRYRYQLGFNIKLTTDSTASNFMKSIYITASDEIMFNSGKEIKYNYFDQNRIAGGLGYQFSKLLNSSIVYTYIHSKKNNPNSYEDDNIISLNLYHSF